MIDHCSLYQTTPLQKIEIEINLDQSRFQSNEKTFVARGFCFLEKQE